MMCLSQVCILSSSLNLAFFTKKKLFMLQAAAEAVGKRPSAVRQAHGPEQSRRAVRQAHGPEQGRRTALPSSLVIAAYFCVRLIPRDLGSLASGHFPSASENLVFDSFARLLLLI
jgi:hypothetical protein